MHKNFDPRVWNLFAGVALLTAGCGARVAGQESGETGETGETNDTNPESPDGSECIDASDCPAGYGCYDGVCMYYPHHDGWVPYYDCYSDEECDQFEICNFGYCELLDSPPEDCAAQGLALPIPTPVVVEGEALALTFADVDADGQDELVVATATQLLVYEAGGGDPIASLQQPGTIKDMVAGDFDAAPGEDVVLLVDEALVLYGSNGDGSFAAPVTNLPPLGAVVRLLAAELDGQPPTDLIGWGGLGAFIAVAGDPLVISEEQYQAGAAHDFGAAETSLGFRRGSSFLDFYQLDGTMFGVTQIVEGPATLAAFSHGGDHEYVNLVHYSGWSIVQAHDLAMASHEWAIEWMPTQVFAGDLDGDGNDELVFFDGANVALERDPGGTSDCWHPLPVPAAGLPVRAVFGDHDGDGDDELAIRTDTGEVVIFDE